MIQFFAPDIRSSGTLGPEETRHCLKVLRKKPGDIIYVTDGQGSRFECRIAECGKYDLRLEVVSEERVERARNYTVTLAVAPTKNLERMSWLVEKAVEIGVDSIVFVKCRYSDRKEINTERLRRNALSAMNQSLKTTVPEISGIKPLAWLYGLKGEKFFGYCSPEIEKAEFAKCYDAGKDVVIAIGPEGDFSKEEVKELLDNDFKAVTFGKERLRTETAALYGVTAVHVLNNLKD